MVIVYSWLKKTIIISLFFTVSNNKPLFFNHYFIKFFIIYFILYIILFRTIVIFINYFMTGIIVTKLFIKSDKRQDMDSFNSGIVDPLQVYSPIPNHNAFSFAIMHYLTNSRIKNMNITLTSKCMEMSKSRNKFADSFVRSNAVCAPINSMIFDICNRLNNLIPKSFGQEKFF